MKNILFVGLGNMGLPIATKLSKTNNVFTLDSSKKKQTKEKKSRLIGGFSWNPEVQIDIVFLCLPDYRITFETINKLQINPQYIIDLTTGSINQIQSIETLCRKKGIIYFASPMSGSIEDALQGKLCLMVGNSNFLPKWINQILKTVSNKLFFYSSNQEAVTIKLINQYLHLSTVALIRDVFTIIEDNELDKNKTISALLNCSGSSKMLERFGLEIANNEFKSHFSLQLAFKDIELVEEILKRQVVFFNDVRAIYQDYNKNKNFKDKNFTIICKKQEVIIDGYNIE
ncbi:NAD(P)-dependent oxidoreductase [Listeria booriae]|uniref:NAD(P)-binding domain-containing protein n=1 Tax=Listeria booriae TaxID=1552123 RepID=UPI001628A9E4|nr:NAD(P)-binding domain-containing protein [Listeria booriae]MBC1230289.1 NAD(P)-dependent oxidoreductase [Listeria booriae]